MKAQSVFQADQQYIRIAAPFVTAYIAAALVAMTPPKSLAERNLDQLKLARKVAAAYEMDIVHAVEAVAPMYAAKFPKPQPPRKVVRRVGNASIILH
jgi:hypothetical protein